MLQSIAYYSRDTQGYWNDKDYYGYIYLIYDQKYNKIYIGQKKGKIEDSRNYYGSGKIIRRILENRGDFFLKKIILGICDNKENLIKFEAESKIIFNSLDFKYGYNIVLKDNGGDTLTNNPNRDLICKKMSKLKKEKFDSGKIIVWNKGKKTGYKPWTTGLTKETDERLKRLGEIISKANKGRKSLKKGKSFEKQFGKQKADEIKQRMSNSLNGRKIWSEGKIIGPRSDEIWNKNIPKEKQYWYGKHHLEETKEKIRKATIGNISRKKDYWVLKQKEINVKNMNNLKNKKPKAYEKIQNIPKRIEQRKSVALLQAHIDYRCSLRCRHCSITRFRENIPEPMTMKTLKIVTDQADAYQISSFCISGGEPLSFPNLEEIINTIDSSRFVLSMDTNGMFLDKQKIFWLVNQGVDRIHLSIDGLENHHSEFRKTKGLWKHNIDLLPTCKRYGLDVIINVVSTKSLIESGELERQLKYLQKTGNHISMIFPKPVGSFEDAKDQVLNTKDIEYLESLTKKYNCSTHLTPAYGRDMGCIAVRRHFSVLPDSRIMCCPWIPVTFGSILEEGLDTILTRMLKMKWFSWDTPKHTCMSGNVDSYFYQNVLPQLENFPDEYPVDYRKINFHEEYFDGK